MASKLFLACFLVLFTQYVSAYSVSGNKLLGPDGSQVRLRGANKCSFEWSPTGEEASLAQYQMMRSWGMNVIRVPLNQDFWLSGSSTYNSGYQANIAQQVAWIKSCGMGVILDLHWSDQGNLHISGGAGQQVMADLNSITFWGQVANAYKNDPWVMFELYNEPHDVSWSIWQTGGTSQGFTVAGMQQLYNAVRATGANNVCIIGGLNWAYDLSGVASYAITGTNIAYASHAYDYPGKQSADWNSGFGYLVSTYPVILTEFGQYCNTDTYVSDLVQYAESNGVHWVAWAWYPGGCSFPAIINDWTGTPTAVGTTVKNTLAAAGTSTSTSAPYTAPTTTTNPGTGATSAPVPATPAPAPAAPATPGSTSLVYDNALQNGWVDYSWATRSLTNTNPVYSGTYSISFTLSAYGGIYFHRSNGLTVGSYQSIQFYTNGPSANVQVRLYDNSNPIGTAVSLPSASSSGSWTLQSIPLSSLGVSSTTQFYGFAILYTQQGSGGTLYVDQVTVVAGTTTPATAAPVTPAPVTPAPATKAPVTAAPVTPAPVTPAPATPSPATKAPVTAAPVTPAPATPSPSSGSGCSAANVVITQTLATTFQQSGQTVHQYNVNIQNTCTSKTLTSLTMSATGWNTVNFWNLQASGNTITVPSYVTIGASGTYSSAGYQNIGGQATFTVTGATFH